MSGYTYCACRDCMDTAVSSDTARPELCELCQEAGCVAIAPYNERVQYCTTYECQREDAYEEGSPFCPYSNLQAQQNMGAVISNGGDLGAYDAEY